MKGDVRKRKKIGNEGGDRVMGVTFYHHMNKFSCKVSKLYKMKMKMEFFTSFPCSCLSLSLVCMYVSKYVYVSK
jgi:hypothetical protein